MKLGIRKAWPSNWYFNKTSDGSCFLHLGYILVSWKF